MLNGEYAAVLVTVAADEVEDRGTGNGDHARVRCELRTDGCRMIGVAGGDATGPRGTGVAAHCDALPRVHNLGNINSAVIVEAANNAIGIARPDGARWFVLLLEPFVPNVVRIGRRAHDVHISSGISRSELGECRLR